MSPASCKFVQTQRNADLQREDANRFSAIALLLHQRIGARQLPTSTFVNGHAVCTPSSANLINLTEVSKAVKSLRLEVENLLRRVKVFLLSRRT